jgi:poly(3-hydroxybutyrate) depolymerase
MVVVPAGYEQTTTRYPVVEVLHGSPGRPDDLFVGGDLLGGLSTAGAATFITVVPDGHGPVVADGDFADTSRQRLGTAMSEDLRRWVDATYRTNGVWGVAGVSAGGFGAAYLGARLPFAYRAVCAIGGYFEARSPAFSAEPAAVRQRDSPLLHASGSGPATLLIVPAGDPKSALEATRYQRALSLVGQPVTVRQVTGAHDYDAFRRALPQCLHFAATGDASPQQGVNHPQMPYTGISPREAQPGRNPAHRGRSAWKDTHA